MQLLIAAILGIVQGVGEFLPISSTGHLILVEKLLGVSQDTYGLTFDAALHMGTLVAVVWYFRSDIFRLITSVYSLICTRCVDTQEKKLALYLTVATIPAVFFGLLFEDVVEGVLRSPIVVAVSLILFSGVLWYVEKFGSKKKDLEHMSLRDSIIIGFSQSIALIPGVSRSGITIASGMFQGLSRVDAARFTFLLSIPIIAGAGGIKFVSVVVDALSGRMSGSELSFFGVGIFFSGVFGYLSIAYLLKFLTKHGLYPFIIYRVILGVVVLAVSLLRI